MNSSTLFEKQKNWVSNMSKSTRTESESAKTSNTPNRLKAAGVSTIYLQFDGLTPDVYKFIRGVDLLETKMKAIQNLREAGFDSIVLVVTLVKGVNDGQLGDIVNFALKTLTSSDASTFNPFRSADACPSRNGKKCASPSPTSCVWWSSKQTAWLKLMTSTLSQQLHPSPKQSEPSKTNAT